MRNQFSVLPDLTLVDMLEDHLLTWFDHDGARYVLDVRTLGFPEAIWLKVVRRARRVGLFATLIGSTVTIRRHEQGP